MTREVLVGFDSAWTDQIRNPGAVAGLVIEDGMPVRFLSPRLATFGQAADFVAALPADLLLVAIDQPTIVPNLAGCRPVERVAASVVNALGGGVQPGRRGGAGASMFGDDAPIWRFLAASSLAQDPERSRAATTGRFAIEVFPALALPSLIPAIWSRRRAAKYNPAQRRTFLPADWQLVCGGLAGAAGGHGLTSLAEWAGAIRDAARPRKADQDRLDAALCLMIAWLWRHAPRDRMMVIGDIAHGCIVTPATADTRAVLAASARRLDVPHDEERHLATPVHRA